MIKTIKKSKLSIGNIFANNLLGKDIQKDDNKEKRKGKGRFEKK